MLIFLVSQPRAGSTLVQELIAKHPEIGTEDEPWLMLPLIKATQADGHQADYDASLAAKAFEHLTKANGMDVHEGVRLQATSVYQRILEYQGKKYFLDKTPRYYNILPELRAIFPQSLIIVLFRNPLAVLCSIIDTWTQHRWWDLSQYKHDLLEAPQRLSAFLSAEDSQQFVLHYENIVQDPSGLAQIFRKLNLAELEDYNHFDPIKGEERGFGDSKIRERTQVESSHAERWQTMLDDPQIWRVVSDYLDYLGSDTIEMMGYNCRDLRKILDSKRPFFLWRWLTVPLLWLLNEKPVDKRHALRFLLSRLAHRLWRLTSKKR